MRDVTMRDVLIYMDTIYEGNWDKIFNAIQCKVRYSPMEIIKLISEERKKFHFITIIDEDYPSTLKGVYKPPFVIKVKRAK